LTLKRFADRGQVTAIVDVMLAQIIRQVVPDESSLVVDSTGLETTSASAQYCTHSGRKHRQYVKVSVSLTCPEYVARGQ
jgi:hypothetical protein